MHSEASSLLEPIKPADADAAELAALRAVYDNEEVPVDPEEQAARRRDTCRALAVAVAVAATGWALYYEFGDVAIFAYGIVVSASHYAYQRFFQAKASPHPLTTLAFANCVVLVVAYASLRTKERRAWLVTWNGVVSGFATALLVVARSATTSSICMRSCSTLPATSSAASITAFGSASTTDALRKKRLRYICAAYATRRE